MNYRVVYDLALVLTKSQLRGYQRSRLLVRLFGDPRIVLLADVLLLGGLGGLGLLIVSRVPTQLRSMIPRSEGQALAGIPTAIAFAVIVFGVLYEVSQPAQIMNTDLVNWLPVSPAEYTAGSTISECYLYSFMACLFLGVLLGPAIYLGVIATWLAAVVMSTISLFAGACVVELIDASTNRISSTFYKRSGRSAILFRLAITIFFLVFIQLLFSGQIAVFLLQSLVRTVEVAWFVPVVWSSVSVLSLSQGDLVNAAVFGTLSVAFAAALFGVAVGFRRKFWVPIPVSVRLSSRAYHPIKLGLKLPGIGAAESAILLKDFRSLVRRREMARFLAVPFVLAVSMSLPMLSPQTQPMPAEIFTQLILFVIPLVVFCNILGMTSIGQEGHAIWNLYAAPLKPETVLKAKFLLVTFLGLIFAVAMVIVLGIFSGTSANLPTLLLVGVGIVLEQASIGTFFGCRFPDFRETGRARYVSVWGSLAGTSAGLIVALVTVAPLILATAREIGSAYASLSSVALAMTITGVALKAAVHQLGQLFRNIQS